MITEQAAAELFAGMDDEAFREFIGARLGPSEPRELWDALLHPDTLPRTKEALLQIQEQTNRHITDRKAEITTLRLESMAVSDVPSLEYVQAKAEFDDWSRRAKAYRQLLNRRVRDVQSTEGKARRRAHEDHQARNHDRSRAIATRLTLAIYQHRATSLALDIKPEPHDRELWALLDELTIELAQQELTLAEAVEYGYWAPRTGEAGYRPAGGDTAVAS